MNENLDKLDIILESLERIEARLKKLECFCQENKNNFMREVGANILGDYLYDILDKRWFRNNN